MDSSYLLANSDLSDEDCSQVSESMKNILDSKDGVEEKMNAVNGTIDLIDTLKKNKEEKDIESINQGQISISHLTMEILNDDMIDQSKKDSLIEDYTSFKSELKSLDSNQEKAHLISGFMGIISEFMPEK